MLNLLFFQDPKPITSIPLDRLSGEVALTEMSKKKKVLPFGFQVPVPNRTYIFASTDQGEIEDWLATIKRSTFVRQNAQEVFFRGYSASSSQNPAHHYFTV